MATCGYLNAAYGLIAVWAAENGEIDRARRALRLQRLKVSDREDAFAAIIQCTADPGKVDRRTRSKWSRIIRYAAVYKPDSEALNMFIRRKGGIRLRCPVLSVSRVSCCTHCEAKANPRVGRRGRVPLPSTSAIPPKAV